MLTAAQVLAENNFGDTRSGGLAGPMGLFLIVVLAIATVLLIRNMNARLRRLPDRFPDQGPAGEAAQRSGTVAESAGPVDSEESSGAAGKAGELGQNPHSA